MSTDTRFKLYTYWRSSAAYRVRIALALKGLDWDAIPVNLVKSEEHDPKYLDINPQGLVPALVDDATVITQSLAIIEYLDQRFPAPALLPDDLIAKATVRSMAYQIAMEIHPLNNLRVLNYLTKTLDPAQSERLQWYRHWTSVGFSALEKTLESYSNGKYCYGDSATIADICLIPQVYNAHRFECPLESYPLITSIWNHCNSLPTFQSSAPEAQQDCPKNS
jgi:maleylacetoacetate isomerase